MRAVPKKKTSHMKKRHRFMHNNGQKDTTALNKCSACGHLKRAHLLCPYCVKGKNMSGWSKNSIPSEANANFRGSEGFQGTDAEGS